MATDSQNASNEGPAICLICNGPEEEDFHMPEEEQLAKEKAWEQQMALRAKRLEMEKAWSKRQLQLERDMREQELLHERELQNLKLKQEQELLDQQLKAEEEFLRKREDIRQRGNKSAANLKRMMDEVSLHGIDDGAEGTSKNEVQLWLDKSKLHNDAKSKPVSVQVQSALTERRELEKTCPAPSNLSHFSEGDEGNVSLNTMAFIDEGSSSTLIDKKVANALKAKGIMEPLVVTWTADIKRFENDSRRISLLLSAKGSHDKIMLENVRTVSERVLPKQSCRYVEIAARLPHLSGLPVADHTGEEPAILIGLDNLHLFAPLESRVGKAGEPIAVRSRIESISNQELHDMLRAQYVLDEAGESFYGIPESAEIKRAKSIQQSTTVRVGDRFQTGLLWRTDSRQFPDSFPMATGRAKALKKRLEANVDLMENVCNQIENYQVKGYAHKATREELSETPPSSVWYLILNVVLNPKKPKKVRLVWDAAASVNGISLNTELLAGPDMLTSLPDVTSRFRERPIAFGGDIEEMYHQIRVRSEDKSAQRFLFQSPKDNELQVYVMDVLTFGSTCSPSSAQFVKNLNVSQFAEEFPEAAAAIVDHHYVDDYYYHNSGHNSGSNPSRSDSKDIWRTGCEWDEEIDDSSFERWKKWSRMLPEVEAFHVPRCYFGNAKSHEVHDVQLHVSTDTSETAYGCVAFFRAIINGEVKCALVMSRSKVAPLKLISIPRLELQGAVEGARLARKVRENHSIKISKQFFWTDSQTVLSWIRSDQRNYKQLVGFRIGEILSLTTLGEWRWIPSRLNVADQLTKWGKDPDFTTESQWIRGPAFLYRKEEDWPNKSMPPANTTTEFRTNLLLPDVVTPEVVIESRRFSKWKVIVRAMACVYKFLSKCKACTELEPKERIKAKNDRKERLTNIVSRPIKLLLSQEEYQKAELYLLKVAQADSYHAELKILMRNKERPANQWLSLKKSTNLYRLTPFIDENGLIRMEGRIDNAGLLPFDLRFPIILPQDHQITTLQSAEALRDAYKRSQQLADDMWKRWIREYLLSINQRTKWIDESRPLKVGDLVYVIEGTSRKSWVRGIVEETIVSSDGRIRQAWVRTHSGVFKRATVKLAVMEIDDSNAGPDLHPTRVTGEGYVGDDIPEQIDNTVT
ncbi:uncharacterized protein LOC128735899 [Sabethes cyaneus]|uniref:uncharacterized protein LOC128735899 n=1 Tax=Sabethes cyaneus TaxID=53552 RepID=UPI00237E865D|nr:uncharacterized protein LOC128735899 [Sabethes cyaneus]